MSTQTEPQTKGCSVNMQQSTQVRCGFEGGQEDTSVQCDMSQTMKADGETIEIENYANNLWLELQRESDQDTSMGGQEQPTYTEEHGNQVIMPEIEQLDQLVANGTIEMFFDATMNQHQYGSVIYVNEEADDSTQVPELVPSDNDDDSQIGYVPGLVDDRAIAGLGLAVYTLQWLESEGYPRDPGGPMKEESINDSSKLMLNSEVDKQKTGLNKSDQPCEQQWTNWDIGRSFTSEVHMTGAEEKDWQSQMQSFTWSRDSVGLGHAKTGGDLSAQDEPKFVRLQFVDDKDVEAYVTHWQELENSGPITVTHRQEPMAPVHTVGEKNETDEVQDHNYRHGAQNWGSVDEQHDGELD